MLKSLFSSRTRVRLLALFLTNPRNRFYLREIERRTKEHLTPLSRELNRMAKIGFLNREKKGNLVYFFVNDKFPIYNELKSIILKTEGLGNILKERLKKLGNIRSAFIYGSAAKDGERLGSDIDLMIIGRVNMAELGERIRGAEESLGREINCSVFAENEWLRKKKNKTGFINEVLKGKKIFLIGSDSDV